MKRGMKRDERKDDFLFLKNVREPSNPPDELAQNVSKKSFSDELLLIFPSKVQNLTVFSIIHMIRIRFFGPRALIQRSFFGRMVLPRDGPFPEFLFGARSPWRI